MHTELFFIVKELRPALSSLKHLTLQDNASSSLRFFGLNVDKLLGPNSFGVGVDLIRRFQVENEQWETRNRSVSSQNVPLLGSHCMVLSSILSQKSLPDDEMLANRVTVLCLSFLLFPTASVVPASTGSESFPFPSLPFPKEKADFMQGLFPHIFGPPYEVSHMGMLLICWWRENLKYESTV